MVMQLVKGYEALKPVVERISEKTTLGDVNNLNDLLKETSPNALEKLQDFILAHLMKNVIDPNINPELKCSILQCVLTTLENISISTAESILRLLSFLFSQVFDAKEPTMIRQVPEELKLKVVKCALAVVQNTNEDIHLELFRSNHVPALSHSVYICVTLAKHEQLQDLRITAMRVVMSLSLISPVGALDTSDPHDRRSIADTIQFMLPGIVSNMINIIRGPITQGSKITATAVRTLGGVIALVLEDYDWGNSEQSADSIMALVKSSLAEEKSVKNENDLESEVSKPRDLASMQRALTNFKGRTPEWRHSCAKKLLPALEEIGKLQTHPHWRVRNEVAWVAALIVTRCPKSLYDGLSPLLNALLHLKGDDQPEIRQFCLQAISEIQDLFAARCCKSFKELVEENMYNLLTKLPRLVQEDCGENTPAILSLLAGYIELLGSDLKLMLNVPIHLQRFSLAILQALVLDSSSIVLTPEYSFRELKSTCEGGLRAPWVRFEHCSGEEALRQISRLVEALSTPQTSDALDLIARQILALVAAVPSIACEAALFLNELLKSGQGDRHHLATLALDVYLDPVLYNVSFQGDMSLSQSQKNVLRICILTEGVGCCIKAMNPTAIEPSLLRGLYPVLERAGSANYLIATAGLQALSLMANVTGHQDNIISLLNANMDYISHTLSTRLRRPHENPAVFDALTLVLRHASQDTLPGIRDIVNDVLLRSCDEHKETHAEAHLRVFWTFASCVNSWLKGEEDSGHDEFENDDENEVVIEPATEAVEQKWRSFDLLLDYHKNVVQAVEDVDMDDDDDMPEESGNELPQSKQPHLLAEQQRTESEKAEQDDEKPKPPPEILLLESVMRRSLHFVTSPDSNIVFLALRTMAVGMHALSAFPNVLLPLAHTIWAPLVGRLRRDQPPLIFRTAFGLLCSMADSCKDFLRPRIVKEIFPELTKVLESSEKKSHLQDKGSAFRFSQLYKLQKAILSRAGHLCINLKLEGDDFRSLLIAALPYLSCYQPRPLQKHCINFLRSLKTLDDDLVWWNIATMWGTQSVTSSIKVPPGNAHFCAETTILLEQNQR